MEDGSLKVHWYTDRGRRPSNEDAVSVETLFGDRDFVAVADGMGGHAGGEVASEKALETLLAFLESSNELTEGVRRANQALLNAAAENPKWKGMGTTLVALLRVGDHYHVANVGDSRAYRLDRTGIRRITEDHSFTAEAISSGRLSEDEAERSPWRNALTRAVGTDEEVDVDIFGPFPVEPAHLVLLCSDGLYRVMDDDELAREVFDRGNQADAARNLVADALRRGSSDNISVAVVEFGEMEASTMRPDLRAEPPTLVSPPGQPAPVLELAPSVEIGNVHDLEDEPVPAELLDRADPAEEVSAVASPAQIGESLVDVSPPEVGSGAAGGGQGAEAQPAGRPSTPAYRPARRAKGARSRAAARVRPLTRKRSKSPGLPPWVKREMIPAFVLIGLTLALVFLLTSVLG